MFKYDSSHTNSSVWKGRRRQLASSHRQEETTSIQEEQKVTLQRWMQKHFDPVRRSLWGCASAGVNVLTFQGRWGQLAKGGGGRGWGRCWGRQLTELQKLFLRWFQLQAASPLPAGSHATTCNTLWMSVWLFSGGTCGGLGSFSSRWHPLPPWETLCEGSLTKYWEALGRASGDKYDVILVCKKTPSRTASESHWLFCCWLSTC